MPELKLAYSTRTADPRRGWDEFDRMVARAVERMPGASVDALAGVLPAGLSFHLITRSIEWLVAHPAPACAAHRAA